MKEPKEFDYFKAWLLFFLISTVGGGLLVLFIYSFLAAFLPLIMVLASGGEKPFLIAVFVIVMPISYVTFRAVVGKYLFPKIEDDTPQKV